MVERPLRRSGGTRGHRSAPVILDAGHCLLDGEDPCPASPRGPKASPAHSAQSASSLANISPRTQTLVQAMDRLAGIDIRRTFDLDGSGFVSTAVLRRSLSAFDPQVFTAQCLQLMLGPVQGKSVRIQDVFGPFWEPLCRRVQLLEEKLAQTKRQSQRRQVELAQTAQDTADALRLAKQELSRLQHDRGKSSGMDDERSLLELRERLAHSEQQRKKMEEQLRKATRTERQAPPKACMKVTDCDGIKGRRRRGTPLWQEEASESLDLAQQLLSSSEQRGKALEQELRRAMTKLDEAEREKQQLQQSLQQMEESHRGEGPGVSSPISKPEEPSRCEAAEQELERLDTALAAQTEACRRKEEQLQQLSAEKEELALQLAQAVTQLKAEAQSQPTAEELQEKIKLMEDEVIQVRQTMALREREAVEAVHHAVTRTKAEVEESLRGSVDRLENQAAEASERVSRTEAESQELGACVQQISGELAKLRLDLEATEQSLAESKRQLAEAASTAAEREARLAKAQSQQQESENRLEFLSGEVIKLKLESATLQRDLLTKTAEASRLEQEGRSFQEQAARSSRKEEEMRAELTNQLAELRAAQLESKDLARELELRGPPEQRFEALDGSFRRLEGRLQEMTLQFLSSAHGSTSASAGSWTLPDPAELARELVHEVQRLSLGRLEGKQVDRAYQPSHEATPRTPREVEDVNSQSKKEEELLLLKSQSETQVREKDFRIQELQAQLEKANKQLHQDVNSQSKQEEELLLLKSQSETQVREKDFRIQELQAQLEKANQQLHQDVNSQSKKEEELLLLKSQSETQVREKDFRIQELQKQLDEANQQLHQVQSELDERSLEAAFDLAEVGQDVDAIEWESGKVGRKLEAQIAEIKELEKDAEETVGVLSEELDRSNAKLAESEDKRKELAYHLEDTSAKLDQAQAELIDAADALAAATEDQEMLKGEIRRLRGLLADSEGSECLSPQLLLPPQAQFSPNSGNSSVRTNSAGTSPA